MLLTSIAPSEQERPGAWGQQQGQGSGRSPWGVGIKEYGAQGDGLHNGPVKREHKIEKGEKERTGG